MFIRLISLILMAQIVFASETPSDSMSTLTLEQFLAQVKQKHLGFQGLTLSADGARLRAEEGSLLTAPSLYTHVQYLDDQKPTNNPGFLGNRTRYQSYTLGVAKQTSFGLLAKLSYHITHTNLQGTNPAFVPTPAYYTNAPMLELSQSLWRNGFGSETRATVAVLNAQAKASSLIDIYKAKMLLAESEGVYWRLAVAQEVVLIQKDGVERARKIRDWSARRARLQLADRSDELQAEAGMQGKELELQAALDEEKDAARIFNSLRGTSSDTISEKLELAGMQHQLESLEPVTKKGMREDVLAADQVRKATVANTELGRDKNSPNLDLMGSFSLNGKNVAFGQSASDSFKTNQPTYGVGVKLSAPLDLGTLSDDRAGYVKEEKAAELNFQRKSFEDAEDWKDLNRRFFEAKRRLKMALAIEKIQQQKLDHEKARLKTGRSVLYQVLSFEQDYANSQILRVRTVFEILRLMALMKTHVVTENVK